MTHLLFSETSTVRQNKVQLKEGYCKPNKENFPFIIMNLTWVEKRLPFSGVNTICFAHVQLSHMLFVLSKNVAAYYYYY